MRITLLVVAVGAALVAGGAFAWRWWNRTQNIVSHAHLTRLEVGLLNDTCEMCHRPETQLYRGNVKTRPVRQAWKGPVTCTDCHDFVTKQPVSQKCVECHTPRYVVFLAEWGAGFDAEVGLIGKELKRAESALVGIPRNSLLARRADRLMKEAREALDLVKHGRGAHHPEAARLLLDVARRRATELFEIAARE